MAIPTLVEAVKQHALDHYTEGGWDVIAEAWDDVAIAETIGDAVTPEAAIAKFADVVGVYADRQAEARQYQEEAEEGTPTVTVSVTVEKAPDETPQQIVERMTRTLRRHYGDVIVQVREAT